MALTTTEVAEFARRAHGLLNDGGSHWTKGAYREMRVGGERFCLIGAVRQSVFGAAEGYNVNENDPRFQTIVEALVTAIGERFPNRRDGMALSRSDLVIQFNDHDDTTWGDVEAVLTRAEEILDAA